MRCFRLFAQIITPVIVATLVGCGGGGGGTSTGSGQPAPIRSRADIQGSGAWTVLVYLNADNDLESAGVRNFNQMELAGSNQDVRIVVQMDRNAGYDSSNGNWSDTRRYLITRDTNSSTMQSVRLDDPPLGELDMGDWRTLKDFVEWGVHEFPSSHYCLVIWDHGTGWQIRSLDVAPSHKFISADDTSSSGMNVTDIPQALQNVHMDVVAFDACLMQQLETAYELKDSASYVVASAAPEPSPGYDYQAWLSRTTASTTPEGLCRILVDEYAKTYPSGNQGITQSALDTSKIGALANAASEFAQVLTANRTAFADGLRTARTASLNYSVIEGGSQRYSLDLIDYAERTSACIGLPAASALATLKSALSDALVTEIHNPDTPNAHGIGIYMPPPAMFDNHYSQLKLAADTSWDEWIGGQVR